MNTMMPVLTPVDAAFPGGHPVTVEVACRVGGGRAKRHPITIGTDWSVETPHDLELERIAKALGGVSTCVDLVDHAVPALRDAWQHAHRLVPSRLHQRVDNDKWTPAQHVAGCSCSTGWPHPQGAAAHLRGVTHWVRHHGASLAAVKRLVVAIEDAPGVRFDPGAQAPYEWRTSPVVGDPDTGQWLWEVGISPALVALVGVRLGLTEPLRRAAYLRIVADDIDLDWLVPFARDGATAASWAARVYNDHDRSYPTERFDWYRTGLSWPLIDSLLPSRYSLYEITSLAQSAGVTLNTAARTLALWRAADCEPTIEQLAYLRLLAPGRQEPGRAAVDSVCANVGVAAGMSRTQVALVLVAAGTPTTAAGLIRQGVRTLADVETVMAHSP